MGPLRLLLATLPLALVGPAEGQTADWPVTEGAPGGGRYSPLADIHPGNVGRLQVAWTYRHGDFREGPFPYKINKGTSFEATPLVVDGRLLFTTPYNRVIALDPETGRELWTFDPGIDLSRFYANMIINRGVAYWREPDREGRCTRRVFLATLDARLIALDAATGTPCADFGAGGTVDLLADLQPVADPHEYNVTSPGTVVGDVIVVGSSIADTVRPDAPPGDVRAFDVRSGRRVWTFHTVPHEGEPGYETWETGTARSGAANVWSTITADLARGWVFLPVSAASPDFYGGDRPGANLYSDSVVALDAKTGKRIWHFQTVHHDLWDYDLAAPPVLVRVVHEGRAIDAVAQATKTGFVFVLDRETGRPLFPVEERAVPTSDVPGERAWPTQPVPTKPPPLVPQHLTEDDLYAPTPEHLATCRRKLQGLRNEGLFTPPSLEGSILYPFTGGGANWSGAAFDPERRWLFVPVTNLAHVATLKRLPESNAGNTGIRPLRGGLRGLWFLLTGRGTGLRYYTDPRTGRTLFAHDGIPCNAPPWGLLVAVDLDAGTIRWSVSTETNAYGPPLLTASGLLFHAGTRESELRVHEAETGKVLTTFDLPAGLHAGPISYKLRPDGRQFLVIAPGGHTLIRSKLGDHVIAYTLDRQASSPGRTRTSSKPRPQLELRSTFLQGWPTHWASGGDSPRPLQSIPPSPSLSSPSSHCGSSNAHVASRQPGSSAASRRPSPSLSVPSSQGRSGERSEASWFESQPGSAGKSTAPSPSLSTPSWHESANASPAARASTMPAPESRSSPGASMSSAVPVRTSRTSSLVRPEPAPRSSSSAAIAAACGAAAEVPQKVEKPGLAVATQSAAVRSGLARSSPPVAEKSPGVMGVPSAW